MRIVVVGATGNVGVALLREVQRLSQEEGVNLAGIRILFELEERLQSRILENLFDDHPRWDEDVEADVEPSQRTTSTRY